MREAALSVEADDRASALMRALVALLENDGSAEPITEGWRLAPETGYAAPDDLIATLIDRFPAAQAELLLLLELRCRLPQALEAGLPSLSEQTRTLILGEASAFALAIEALDREIEAAKVIAAGRRPRVLALLPCIGAVLERLTRAHIAREIELVVLSTERTGPTSGLPGDVRIYGSDACGPTLRLCDLLVKASFGADEELPGERVRTVRAAVPGRYPGLPAARRVRGLSGTGERGGRERRGRRDREAYRGGPGRSRPEASRIHAGDDGAKAFRRRSLSAKGCWMRAGRRRRD